MPPLLLPPPLVQFPLDILDSSKCCCVGRQMVPCRMGAFQQRRRVRALRRLPALASGVDVSQEEKAIFVAIFPSWKDKTQLPSIRIS